MPISPIDPSSRFVAPLPSNGGLDPGLSVKWLLDHYTNTSSNLQSNATLITAAFAALQPMASLYSTSTSTAMANAYNIMLSLSTPPTASQMQTLNSNLMTAYQGMSSSKGPSQSQLALILSHQWAVLASNLETSPLPSPDEVQGTTLALSGMYTSNSNPGPLPPSNESLWDYLLAYTNSPDATTASNLAQAVTYLAAQA